MRQVKRISKMLGGMIVKNVFAFMIGFVLIFSATVYAESYQSGDIRITVIGKTEAEEEEVSIGVLLPNKKFSDIKDEAYEDVLLYQEQVTSNKDGRFSLDFLVDNSAPTGVYTTVYYKDGNQVEEKFIFSNIEDDTKPALAKIKEASDNNKIEDVEKILTDNRYALQISDDIFNSVSVSKVASFLVNSYKENNDFIVPDSPWRSISSIKKIYIINNLHSIDSLDNYSEALSFDELPIADWYKKSFITDTVWTTVLSRLKKYTYSSLNEFNAKLTEMFVLSAIEHSDGSGNAASIIKAFSSEIGLKINVSNSTFIAVADKRYLTYEELLKEISECEAKKNTSGSGGSSGSSGGGRYAGDVNFMTSDEAQKILDNPTSIPVEIFSDMSNVEWAKEAVTYLAQRGVVTGKTKENFCPNDYVLREEFVALLSRAYNIELVGTKKLPFDDVEQNQWYYPYVAASFEKGIINGYGDNSFGIGDNITRQDIAVILYNFGKLQGIDFGELTSNDLFLDEDISEYAKQAVYSLKNANIVKGVDGMYFNPMGNATRAEAVVMIYRLLLLG